MELSGVRPGCVRLECLVWNLYISSQCIRVWLPDITCKHWIASLQYATGVLPACDVLLKERNRVSSDNFELLLSAAQEFRVFAMDGSSNGVAFARKEAERYNLTIDFRCAVMIDLPYEPETMDYILAWGVIYHGDITVVRSCLRETYRVLCPGGLYHGTMLSKRNSNFGRGQEVAKDTFLNNESGDKSHPHFYCNASELVSLFSKVGLEVISLVDLPDSKPGSYHWHVLAEKV